MESGIAPLLKNTPADALSKIFVFTNGVEGNGIHRVQGEVFTSTPAQPDVYSALTSHVHATWIEKSIRSEEPSCRERVYAPV